MSVSSSIMSIFCMAMVLDYAAFMNDRWRGADGGFGDKSDTQTLTECGLRSMNVAIL